MNASRSAVGRSSSALLQRLAGPSLHAAPASRAHFARHLSFSPRCAAAQEKLQTSTSYQPYPLSPRSTQAPRNDPAPDSSIATPRPEVHETRPPTPAAQPAQPRPSEPSAAATTDKAASAPASTAAQQPSAAATEPEAQKPKPKRKLRPRKAAMTLTPTAVEQLRALLSQPEPKLIKVGVRNRGCSGLAYNLEYVEKPGAFDEEVEQDGVRVLIDSKALFSIIGSEMDWVEDKLNQRFVFRNPNISTSHPLVPLLIARRKGDQRDLDPNSC